MTLAVRDRTLAVLEGLARGAAPGKAVPPSPAALPMELLPWEGLDLPAAPRSWAGIDSSQVLAALPGGCRGLAGWLTPGWLPGCLSGRLPLE